MEVTRINKERKQWQRREEKKKYTRGQGNLRKEEHRQEKEWKKSEKLHRQNRKEIRRKAQRNTDNFKRKIQGTQERKYIGNRTQEKMIQETTKTRTYKITQKTE